MARQFSAAGHNLVADPADADLAVVNTCTVTCRRRRRLTEDYTPHRPQRREEYYLYWLLERTSYPDQALELPGVTRVVSNREKDQLVSQLIHIESERF